MAAKKKAKKKVSKKKVSKKKVSKKKVSKKKAIAKVKPKAPVKVSKALSNKVSKFILMKSNIAAANKQLTEMKSAAFVIEEELLKALEDGKQLGITVASGSIKIKETDVFNAKDLKKINKHIEKTGDFNLYQRRLNTTLLNEYFEAGIKFKGIEHFTKTSLGISHKR